MEKNRKFDSKCLAHLPNNRVFKATILQSLTTAALILPGVTQFAKAGEDDTVDFQYSHYQEGHRTSLNKWLYNEAGDKQSRYSIPKVRNPIEVDSIHGSSRIELTDRIKFAFNFTEDTWSGATPIGSAPEQTTASRVFASGYDKQGQPILTGASPYATGSRAYTDMQGNVYFVKGSDPTTGMPVFAKDRVAHVMSYASPENRQQGDFNLSYNWDEAMISIGGGISSERDYESRFVNLGGRMDFNQKLTTVDAGLSYTNSTINAILNPDGDNFFKWGDAHQNLITFDENTELNSLHGKREDASAHFNLSQVIGKDSLMTLGLNYTHSSGFLENPYKLSWIFGYIPSTTPSPYLLPDGTSLGSLYGQAFIEQRPDNRNQWNWTARWVQYVEPLNAALHLDYQFAHDDWGINAHNFNAEWVQPLGSGWSITPRVRYYSQDAADFYQPFFVTEIQADPVTGNRLYVLPDNFSSDQRLSGFGALSGGLTVSKQFAKGIGIEAGFEYYTHQGSLKLGGNGEGSFADFDYWTANAALKVDLAAIAENTGTTNHSHHNKQGHRNLPAGIMFGHTLHKAGQMMAGYRYKHSMEGGALLHGTQVAHEQTVIEKACKDTEGCTLFPGNMTMNMHMLDLMYAPTDWLTLMLMPQFMDMDMALYRPASLPPPDHGTQQHNHGAHGHETGGIGDTGMYALVNLFDDSHHHLHAGLGFTAPTGDSNIKLKETTKNAEGGYIHYGMQLGSGTWDFKPSITYTGKSAAWLWGLQIAGTKRTEHNNTSGYALGDVFESSIWGGYSLTDWLSGSLRLAYTWQGRISGKYPRSTRFDSQLRDCKTEATYPDVYDENGNPGPSVFHNDLYQDCLLSNEKTKRQNDANDRPSPMDSPSNYGGHYLDLGLGISATVPEGAFGGNQFAFEWLQPLYTDVNGYQLDREGSLSFTWSYGF